MHVLVFLTERDKVKFNNVLGRIDEKTRWKSHGGIVDNIDWRESQLVPALIAAPQGHSQTDVKPQYLAVSVCGAV